MRYLSSRIRITFAIAVGFLVITSAIAFASIIPVILGIGTNTDAPLVSGPAAVTIRLLSTPRDDVGTCHYHPCYVHNIVSAWPIEHEAGCGAAPSYSSGNSLE